MTTPKKISYAFIVLVLVLVCVLHLATPFITMLFAYFALNKLRLGENKGLAVALLLILVVALGAGTYIFLKQAVVVLPKIVATTVPVVIEYAEKNQIELPFSDYESLKAMAREAVADQVTNLGKYLKAALFVIVAFLIGLVVAISLFLNARFQLDGESSPGSSNLYTATWLEIGRRFHTFYESFAVVMGAQIIISLINTALTTGFLLWNHFPHAGVVIVLTFLCGLLPIIGNLISNTLIVGVGFTVAPHMALWALIFLVVIHKLEYFLNSKIVGQRIRNPMWLTLLGLIVGEKLMGIPGMILAPVVLHYIKVEASQSRIGATKP
ncbi:MAG: AI-2E family transporter [Verrucomicrobia bacterium]|nr:MAG: AI-2E family transporter [Verrucomicrobiota bacterium]